MMNREAAPFDKPELRQAVALTIDRKAFVDTLTEGKGDFGGAMLPPPEGVWGMPADMLKSLPGYNPDVAKNRAEARSIMEKLAYGPNKRLKLTVSTRNIPPYRDSAVILIDQLKEVYIDGELDPIDTAQWLPRVMRGDYTIALNLTGNGLDDPDQTLYETSPAAPRAITTGTAVRRSTRWSTGSRWSLIRQSARIRSGQSSASSPRKQPDRSCGTIVPAPAGTLM
jgi:peptide/nickel transport system substrate-binding protein